MSRVFIKDHEEECPFFQHPKRGRPRRSRSVVSPPPEGPAVATSAPEDEVEDSPVQSGTESEAGSSTGVEVAELPTSQLSEGDRRRSTRNDISLVIRVICRLPRTVKLAKMKRNLPWRFLHEEHRGNFVAIFTVRLLYVCKHLISYSFILL